jgi:hypothetical protein
MQGLHATLSHHGPRWSSSFQVGDLVGHCDCGALSPEQQRAGMTELCRVINMMAAGENSAFMLFMMMSALATVR